MVTVVLEVVKSRVLVVAIVVAWIIVITVATTRHGTNCDEGTF